MVEITLFLQCTNVVLHAQKHYIQTIESYGTILGQSKNNIQALEGHSSGFNNSGCPRVAGLHY